MATDYGMDPALATATPPAWPSPPVRPARSGWVLTAAVILFVVGALSALFGLIFLLFGLVLGSSFSDLMQLGIQSGVDSGQFGPDDQAAVNAVSGMFTGIFVLFAGLALLWGGSHIVTGVGLLKGREWARIAGLVLSVIALLFSAVAMVGLFAALGSAGAMYDDPAMRQLYPTPEAAEAATRTGVVVNLAMLLPFVIGYVIVLVTLIRSGSSFGSARQAASTV